jgi:surface polysaccharide O-acyltransferase-like enzyme
MSKNFTTRIIWLDVVRILAIYFVVLVHSLGAAASNSTISSAFASTCVPLFVILSGALLLNKQESYSSFYKKRLLRLGLPWATWTIIYVLIKLFQTPPPDFSNALSLLSATFTSFWFLPMIAGLYLITPALRIFAKGAKPRDFALLIIFWFLSLSVLPYYRNSMAFPFFVDDGIVRQVFTYLGYFLLGAVLIRVKLPKLRNLLALLVLGISLSIINYYLSTTNHQLSPSFSFSYIFPGIIIASAALFASIKSLGNRLDKLNSLAKSLIISLSTASLGIYFVHGLLTDWFLKELGSPYLFKIAFLGEWVNSLVLFALSYLIILGLTRIPYLKRIIA